MIYQQLIQNNIYQIEELNPYHVLQSMQRLQIRSITQKRKTKIKPGEYCEAFQDLVQGDFIPQEPNKVWYTDFTYVKAKGSFQYICIIMDGCDGDVIGRQVSKRIDAKLACDTLEQAISKSKPKGRVILHSDQGGQYRSKKFTALCKSKRIQQSMSRAGTPTDNAIMESFMGKLKTERIHHIEIQSLTHLDSEVRIYSEYYNTQRLHSRHGYLTIQAVKKQREIRFH